MMGRRRAERPRHCRYREQLLSHRLGPLKAAQPNPLQRVGMQEGP
jgi:hypothetical protein